MTQTSRKPRPSPTPGATSLPPNGKRVHGRDALAQRVAGRLNDPACRLLTLTGPGGVGKTTVAQLAIATLPGALFVPLAAEREAAAIPDAAIRALGLPESPDPAAQLAERAARGPLLLALDNVEHLLDAGETIARLLAAAPSLTILATSRVPIRVEGEAVERVEPFAIGEGASLATLWASPGVRIFLDRARDVGVGIDKNIANARAIAAICRRLDGLPLAIELAASRSRLFRPDELRDRLGRGLDLLENPGSDRPSRHATMRSAIAWSHDLLAPAEQALFRRLAVFVGGFSADEAAAIAAGWSLAAGYPAGGVPFEEMPWQSQLGRVSPAEIGSWSPPELPALPGGAYSPLDALLQHGLVRPIVTTSDQSRFTMAEPVREFGLEQLAAHGESDAVRHAFAVQMLSMAEYGGARLWTENRLVWIGRFTAEMENIRAAFAWLARQPPAADQLAARMAETLWQIWQTCGYTAEGCAQIERALARGATDPVIRAAALCVLGILRWSQGDAARAKLALDEGMALSLAHGYTVGEAHAHTFLALVDWMNGDHAGMATHAQAAIPLYTAQDDHVGIGISLLTLALLARGQQDFDTAEHLLRQAREHSSLQGYLWGEATADYYLGETRRARAARAREAGDREAAEADEADAAPWLLQGLASYQRQGESLGMAGCLSGLAGLAANHGAPRRAARLLAGAAKLSEASGSFLPPTEKDNYEALAEAVRRTLGDEAYFQAASVGYLMPFDDLRREAERALEPENAPAPSNGAIPLSAFTDRQREVAPLLAAGLTDQQIADALSISARTVEGHVLKMRAITGSPNRAALVALLNRPA